MEADEWMKERAAWSGSSFPLILYKNAIRIRNEWEKMRCDFDALISVWYEFDREEKVHGIQNTPISYSIRIRYDANERIRFQVLNLHAKRMRL